MPKLRAHGISVSLDGYAAGPDQSLDNPLGVGGEALHEWAVATRTFRETHGSSGDTAEEGSTGVDDEFMRRAEEGIGATIMGHNMFRPIRGPQEDEGWTGWWGDDPPFHHPVFVLTHHPRPSITMQGGTTFHFVDDGIDAALHRAFAAAGGADVRLGGGAATIQQYLHAGLLDELHFVIAPVLLGSGERLFDHLDGGPHGYECVEFISSPAVTHVRIAKTTT
jgi:dihydrofolate reductase